MLLEFLCNLIIPPALVVGGLALLYYVASLGSPEWARRIGNGPWAPQFRLWQMNAMVVIAALLLVAFAGPPGPSRGAAFLVLMFAVLVWFVRNWCNEFVFLMGLRDEDLPGRNDKLIWAVVLLLLAPVGVWLFRSFRMAHWPETQFVRVDYSQASEDPSDEAARQPA